MEIVLSGLLGLLLGGIIVYIYSNSKLKNLNHQILDKQTIIKLIKEHAKFDKVKFNGKPKKKYKKARRSPAKNKTAGMKQVTLK